MCAPKINEYKVVFIKAAQEWINLLQCLRTRPAAKQSELGKHTGVFLVPISSIQDGLVCCSGTVELL